MKNFLRVAALFCLFFLFTGSRAMAHESPFSVIWEDKPIEIKTGTEVTTNVIIGIPSGHFLYKDKTNLDFTVLEGIRVKEIKYPPSIKHTDSVTNKTLEIFPEGEALISITFYAPKELDAGVHETEAVLEFQGCQEKLCLRPEDHTIKWILSVHPALLDKEMTGHDHVSEGHLSIAELLNIKDFKEVMSHGKLIAFLIAFVAGLLTSLTPCVWPLIPVTLLIIGVHRHANFVKNLFLSLSLVAGISVTYSVLGVAAAAVGTSLGFLFQNRIFLLLVVMFFLAMSLSMFGLFTIQLPSSVRNFLSRLGGKGYRGAFLAGVSVGLIATPCVGPVLGPMLVWVASQKEYITGIGFLFVYAMGVGLFYIIVGTFYGTLAGRLKDVRVGNIVKKTFGVALLIPALYYMSSLIPTNGLFSNGVNWRTSEAEALKEASTLHKPAMIIFGAKWCPPCVKLEKMLLNDKELLEATNSVIVLHVDASKNTDEVEHLLDKYNVIGWPTILFVSPDGKVYDDLSIVGDVPSKEELLKVIKNAVDRVNS